ncbi:G-protein coupled receptor Mth2-like isoform X2 [Macrobrachium nipponense]
MKTRETQGGHFLKPNEYFGSSGTPIFMSSLILFLIISTSGFAKEDLNNSRTKRSSSGHENLRHSRTNGSYYGELCCPENKHFEANGCVPFNDSRVFQPPAPFSNVLWTYQGFQCPHGYDPTPFEVNKNARLILDGGSVSLKWRHILIKTTKKFCLSLLPSNAYVGVVCRPNIEKLCADATCIQKCCDHGEVASLKVRHCTPNASRKFSLTFQSASGFEVQSPVDLRVLYRIPNCENILHLNLEDKTDGRFLLTADGYLYQPAKGTIYYETKFCLDHFTTGVFEGERLGAFICSGPGLPIGPTLKDRFYAAGLMISALSLSVTILCNILVGKLRALQDLHQLCHMISLLVGETALFIGYLFSDDLPLTHCIINSIIAQFAFLSAFFWLNVMCVDIHQYVRATVKLVPRNSIQGRQWLRFKCYSAYAWGLPFLITLATAVLHYVPDYPGQTILRPGFGIKSCWFHGDIERLTFFYVWIGALFLANIFLLANTVFMLHKTGAILLSGKRKSVFEEGGNHASNRRNVNKFWQSFSLFALMELCWITEILSWKIPPESLWIPTDIINTLQGFFIFLFFLRNKTKREALKEAILSARVQARKSPHSESNSSNCSHSSKSTTTYSDMYRP